MRIAIPHGLGRDEARRRMAARTHEIAGFIPGGMADVQTDWPSEDHMDMRIAAMGQQIGGSIEIADTEVILSIDLPPALGFVEPMIRGAIESKGRKLLT